MANQSKVTKSDKAPRNSVVVPVREGIDNVDDATARTLTRPEVQAATVIQTFQAENHEVNALIRELTLQIGAVHRGDLSRPEGILIAQAHVLDEIFASLARRSYANITAGYPDAAERYMRLAFKAQSQCRTTLETLAEIKNPRPVAFVKQANIAHGPQQVNNGGEPRARENQIQSNELSGNASELLPDTRASTIAGGPNPPLETVGALDRPAHACRQNKERTQ